LDRPRTCNISAGVAIDGNVEEKCVGSDVDWACADDETLHPVNSSRLAMAADIPVIFIFSFFLFIWQR